MAIQHRWQCLGSPAHYEQTVYAASSSDFVYALDSATGEVRWRTELQNSSISSPAIAEGKVFVGSWDDHIYALDEKSGTHLWNFWAGDSVLTSVTHGDSTVYAGSNDGYLYALDSNDGSLRWRFRTGGEVQSTQVLDHGVLYFASNDEQVYAVDSVSGREIWKFDAGDHIMAPPIVYEDTVYVGSHDNRLYALAAADDADVMSSKLDSSTTTPAFALLSPQGLIEKLDFEFSTTLNVEGVVTVHDSDGPVWSDSLTAPKSSRYSRTATSSSLANPRRLSDGYPGFSPARSTTLSLKNLRAEVRI